MQNMNQPEEAILYSVAILGAQGVGKTSLARDIVRRYNPLAEGPKPGNIYRERIEYSTAADKVTVEFTDYPTTARFPRYSDSTLHDILDSCQMVLLVCNINDQETINYVTQLAPRCRNVMGGKIHTFLVFAMDDGDFDRQTLTNAQLAQIALGCSSFYGRCSVQMDDNVEQVIYDAINILTQGSQSYMFTEISATPTAAGTGKDARSNKASGCGKQGKKCVVM